jgi:hypothetical protein
MKRGKKTDTYTLSKRESKPVPFKLHEKVTLFRSVRSDELFGLLSHGIVAHCNHCPIDPCCKVTDGQHINSGSKSKIKSRYISSTKKEDIAAWWSANTSGNPTAHKSATYIEFEDTYDDSNMIDAITQNYGATANNRAKMSAEVLILDHIPISKIANIYRVKTVDKSVFDKFSDDGSTFRRIFSIVQGKPKYLLTWNIWSTNTKNVGGNDLVYNKFPVVDTNGDTRISEIDSSIHDTLIGQRIYKLFDGISYQGTVVGVIGKRYYVKYDDDDSEEMNKTEVETHLLSKRVRTSVSPISKSRKRSRLSGGKRRTMRR